jgi:hypothetical protein
MRAIYLANVGNRDVCLDGRLIPAEESRATGEAILRRYQSYRERLSAPIIEAGLRHVLGRGTREDPVLLSVWLFATNQDESAAEHRSKDTVHLAHALGRYLPERFPPTKPARSGHVEDVRVGEIRQNPSYYDEMYEFFGEQLRGGRLAPEKWDACYVSPVGGVPAANFALLLRAVDRYAEKCHPIYVPEGSRHAVAMDVGDQLRRGMLRALARQEVENYEFGRATALLREVEAGPVLVGLAEHAEHRLHFDFARASRVLEDEVMPAARGGERELALRLRGGLEELIQRRLEALIGELYYNARVTYHEGRYVDFLLRLFRLQEAILRLTVERELHVPTDEVERRAHPELVKGIEDNEALRQHMAQPYHGDVLDYHRPPTLPVLRHLVDYYLATGGEEARARHGRLVATLDRLEKLASLRNKSIGAHGFEGVSEEEIRRRYGEDQDLLADLAEVVRLLGVEPADDPFDRVRDAILAGLAREK